MSWQRAETVFAQLQQCISISFYHPPDLHVPIYHQALYVRSNHISLLNLTFETCAKRTLDTSAPVELKLRFNFLSYPESAEHYQIKSSGIISWSIYLIPVWYFFFLNHPRRYMRLVHFLLTKETQNANKSYTHLFYLATILWIETMIFFTFNFPRQAVEKRLQTWRALYTISGSFSLSSQRLAFLNFDLKMVEEISYSVFL